ncbi:MAG: S-adenosylmethionine:tRNA ribosyltransferase-isomerase [Bacteroidaceae bacterium]|nr:S-adenosylmethionine:tRNA ribosyltransferase-isomerase [Bacteroidaceae bacterium]
MQDPRKIQIKDFNYPLPDERIAKFPLAERDHSKLLIYDRGQLSERHFYDLPGLLPKGALLVMNNTRVIQARLHFFKETGARVEILVLEPALPAEYQENFAQRGRTSWYCMVGGLKKWKQGSLKAEVEIEGERITVMATRNLPLPPPKEGACPTEQKGNDGAHAPSLGGGKGEVLVTFTWPDRYTWSEILEAMGELPIPPYLNRKTEESDKRTYQTVYSKIEGSVAAPTAGLHFTQRVLDELDRRGIEREEVTLHVGAGTFRPVKSEDIGGHDMHTEHIAVHRRTIEKLIEHGGRAIAVGTTSVRTLESLYWLGVKLQKTLPQQASQEFELHVSQWEPYTEELSAPLPNREGLGVSPLSALLAYMDAHELDVLHASTQIIIAPGYRYRIVERMITNFHQPQSTLLLLVSAFIGDDWRRMYQYALDHDFRFLSYGDSSILIPNMNNTESNGLP